MPVLVDVEVTRVSDDEPTELPVHALVRRLNSHLGATLVATLANTRDRQAPLHWARPGGPTPDLDTLTRLRAAHRAWLLLADHDGDDAARAWFVGANPLLGDVAPVVALREGRNTQVMTAARAYADGAWHG